MNPLTKNPASSVQKKAEVDFLVTQIGWWPLHVGVGVGGQKENTVIFLLIINIYNNNYLFIYFNYNLYIVFDLNNVQID